jgi:hypothetical protein
VTKIRGGVQTQVGEPRSLRDVERDAALARLEAKESERAHAASDIREALQVIEFRDGRPDEWERSSLVNAIEMLARGHYGYASLFSEQAMTPSAERTRLDWSIDPRLNSVGLGTLKHAFEDASAQPVLEEAHFYPVPLRLQP